MTRLRRLALAWVVAAIGVAVHAARAHAEAPVVGVELVSMTVSDLDEAVGFYTRVLGFEKESEREVLGPEWEALTGVFGCRMRIARLRLGDERLELVDYLAPRSRAMPEDARANDQAFQHIAIVVSDMERAYAHLRAHGVEHASTGPQTLPMSNPNAGGIKAFYFRDPDGHFLEVIWFPVGKGDSRWRRETSELFLGIDHTAIVVENTERSLAFYRDVLGLRVAGGSMNDGTEQAHLNNVEAARLRITTLRAAQGPGVELLEYQEPSETRPTPTDARPSDVAWWSIHFRVRDASAMSMIESRGTTGGVSRRVSRGDLRGDARKFPESSTMMADPDSHGVVLSATDG